MAGDLTSTPSSSAPATISRSTAGPAPIRSTGRPRCESPGWSPAISSLRRISARRPRLPKPSPPRPRRWSVTSPGLPGRPRNRRRARPRGWVGANVARCARCSSPLTERLGERLAKSPMAPSRSVRDRRSEVGVLLGYTAQRCSASTTSSYRLRARRAGSPTPSTRRPQRAESRGSACPFRPLDFRMWIALHEATHPAPCSAACRG